MKLMRGTVVILLLFAKVTVFDYDWPAHDIGVRKTFAQGAGAIFEP